MRRPVGDSGAYIMVLTARHREFAQVLDGASPRGFNYRLPRRTLEMSAPATVLNPYAKFLGDARPHDVLDMTPVTLSRLVHHSDTAKLTHAPAPGKWSIRDILCHLADCEIAFGFRLRQTIAEKLHHIQPFDQEAWSSAYPKLDAHDALDTFASLRRWNMLFIRAVGPAAESKTVRHPERGDMTFRTIVETMAGHDINHLRQIENLV